MKNIRFDNRLLRRLPIDVEKQNFIREVKGACFSMVKPTPVQHPSLVAVSPSALSLLGIPISISSQVADPLSATSAKSTADDANATLVSNLTGDIELYLSGNELLEGSEPASHCYCGHQFGSFAGQLGDGAAIYLGEVQNPSGGHWELQLKGAGPTPYSRSADGRKVLRSSLREFIGSEYMAAVGIPTTRAATLVTSDSRVARDPVYSGEVVMERCSVISRIAETFIRFGSFEICKPTDGASSRAGPSVGDTEVINRLFSYIAEEFFADIANDCKKQVSAAQQEDAKVKKAEAISHAVAMANGGTASSAAVGDKRQQQQPLAQRLSWQELASTRIFAEICKRTADLVAHWQAIGWCHGVLNTDNMSIVGLTIDYGPYGFMTHFDQEYVCNLSDHSGRYSYKQQPAMCQWNLQKLAESWELMFPRQKATFDDLIVEHFGFGYNDLYKKRMAAKLGIDYISQVISVNSELQDNETDNATTQNEAAKATSAAEREEFVETTVTELIGELMFALQMSGAEFTSTFGLLKKLALDAPEQIAQTENDSPIENGGVSETPTKTPSIKSIQDAADLAIATQIADLCITPVARGKIIRRRMSELKPNMHPRQIEQLLEVAKVDPSKLKAIFSGNIEPEQIISFLEEENKKVQDMLKLNRELIDYMAMSEDSKKAKDTERWKAFIAEYRKTMTVLSIPDADRRALMAKVNPIFVPFPWVLQEAISHAEDGEYSLVRNMLDRMMKPYEEDSRDNVLWKMTPPAEAEDICVSCSS
eukprot:GILI01003160.1.p1 GENE.GILI01003160.1~~GILI01003160.1.p1  ORF type:complete len:763 (-),score=116.70 GILI01003160.1:104-2392(-)